VGQKNNESTQKSRTAIPDYPTPRQQLQQMKDLNDPHTPDLFGSIQPPGRSPAKTPRQKYYNPGNKRLDMWVSPRCSVQLDDLARLRGCTKRQLVEDLLEQAWQAAKVAMTQAELPGME
jgi:hypothetical protein